MQQSLGVIHIVRNVSSLDAEVALRDWVRRVRTKTDQTVSLDVDLDTAEGFARSDFARGPVGAGAHSGSSDNRVQHALRAVLNDVVALGS